MNFRSELQNVKQAVKKVLAFLRCAIPGLASEDQMDLKLVFSELLYNAVIHGNNGDARKTVRLEVEIDGGVVVGRVMDEGDGFDYGEILEHLGEEDLLGECGRGIRLAYTLTDKMVFNIAGNAIRFCKRVTAHG